MVPKTQKGHEAGTFWAGIPNWDRDDSGQPIGPRRGVEDMARVVAPAAENIAREEVVPFERQMDYVRKLESELDTLLTYLNIAPAWMCGPAGPGEGCNAEPGEGCNAEPGFEEAEEDFEERQLVTDGQASRGISTRNKR